MMLQLGVLPAIQSGAEAGGWVFPGGLMPDAPTCPVGAVQQGIGAGTTCRVTDPGWWDEHPEYLQLLGSRRQGTTGTAPVILGGGSPLVQGPVTLSDSNVPNWLWIGGGVAALGLLYFMTKGGN